METNVSIRIPFGKLRSPIVMSLLAAILTIGMKWTAYSLTGSASLLSDALESGVNLLAAITAGFSLWFASRPADRNHTFGHEKVEYFSIGLEGAFIGIAGLGTIWYAIERLVNPKAISSLDVGSAIVIAASVINFFTAWYLLRSGKSTRSITLIANGRHLMTDVYTSVGIVVGLILVLATGWNWLDAAIAIVVGSNILWTGGRLIFDAVHGLMDHAIPEKELEELRKTIRASLPSGSDFHALRTRRSGKRTFAEFHLLLDGKTAVATAHQYSHQVEDAIRAQFPDVHVTIHFEPIEESSSWEPDLEDLGESSVPITTGNHAG